jgi:hypothetical protein
VHTLQQFEVQGKGWWQKMSTAGHMSYLLLSVIFFAGAVPTPSLPNTLPPSLAGYQHAAIQHTHFPATVLSHGSSLHLPANHM